MGHLMVVDNAMLVDIPTKVISGQIIRAGDWVFIRHEKSKYGVPSFSVCRHYDTEKWAFPLSINSWSWQKGFIDVLVKLKLMSNEKRAEIIELDRQRHIKEQRKDDVEYLERVKKRYAGAGKEIDKVIRAIA